MSNKDLKNINIVIIGHVDSGKSTTCGRLMESLGRIDPRTIEKYAKEANEIGKGSFQFAWVMDKLKSERERGITIKESLNEMFTKTKKITVIDAPGHRDFIKNMISGTSQADVAMLMISGAKGEFEAGISETGQTREHAMLAQTLGIKHIIVCVNKMDTTMEGAKNFSKKRFTEIQSYMTDFLGKLGIRKKNVTYIPISGFHGDNLITKSKRCAWYKGDTLSKIMDELPVPKRPTKKPLRIPIQSKYKIGGIGTVAAGRVETGTIRPGMNVVFEPSGMKTEVKSVEMHHNAVEEALPGDNIGFNVKNINFKELKKGMVVGEQNNNPPKVCESFVARVIILNHKGTLKIGYSPVIFIHSARNTSKIVSIPKLLDKKTGELIEENPKGVKKNQSAIMEFMPEKPLVVEPFSKFPQLGRFSMRDMNVTVGVGVITEVKLKE